jgi:type IV pilus assembly protein PilY1
MRHDVALILSVLSLLAFHATVRADSDVRFNPFNGHYYQRIDQNLDWPAARDYCQHLAGPNGDPGYLATITSELENQFAAQILNGNDGWVGASDSEAEGTWQWVTGPEAGTVFWQGAGSASGGLPVGAMYTNWNGASEPNSFGGNEDHLQLYSSGRWNDSAAAAGQPFVCEFPPRVYYTITVIRGENGAIEPYGNPPGVVAVEEGSDQTFTVIPDRGYRIETFLVDEGLDQLSTDNQYTFGNVQANHTIEVSFSAQYHEIVATASTGGGGITPAGTIQVLDGADKSFTVTSSSGHWLSRVQVDGSPVTLREGQYVFRNISSDHTIAVSFEQTDSTEISTTGDTIPGCATGKSVDYSRGFADASLNFVNTELQENQVVLPTGYQAIDPDHIVIPFTQKVSVTFLYVGAGYKLSDFGWMLARDGVSGAKHEIYNNINDNDDNGVVDAGINNTTNKYGDSNGDGKIDARDNRRFLDEIEGGTEIVFYLKVDNENQTYYTKTEWNTDTYNSNNGECTNENFRKTYKLGQARTDEGTSQLESGWMSAVALQRVNELFDLSFDDNDKYKLDIVRNKRFSHVVVGASADKPNEWIMGWEDLGGGGDTDHNDLIFIIERQTGGMVQPTEPVIPEQDEAYFTGATLRVYDDMPCAGQTDITYHVSVDNGANWFEITAWDTVSRFSVDESGSKVIGDSIDSWLPGSPASTNRTRRIDFAGLNLTGRELIWKADFKSQQQGCEPRLMGLSLAASIATQGIFSRSSPIIKSNVLYSGSYATPAASWTDKVMRGHLVAWRVYEPDHPDQTATEKLWDAGEVLSQKESLSTRKILFPRITTGTVNGQIGTGGQGARTFSGNLLENADRHILPTTLVITDGREIFRDEHTDVLKGSLGGTGFINRFTGEFDMTFNSAPDERVRITDSYTYYQSSEELSDFVAANVTPAMLGLDETLIEPQGYIYDFNEDGRIDHNDADWLVNWVRGYKDGAAIAKEWPLGPIDHSAPALETPPGTPIWFFGTSVSDALRQSFLDFKNETSHRPAVIYVGSRDGMLHAFDAGEYRYGDNPQTSFAENRGYFERFPENTSDCPEYCDGDCTTCPDYGTGQELWAFIPANLLPRLKYNRLKGYLKYIIML